MCLLFLLILFMDEIKQMRHGIIAYFKDDFWNTFDFFQF